jgi:hypothetical protein
MLAIKKSSLDEGYVMPKMAQEPKDSINYVEIKLKNGNKTYIFTKGAKGWMLKEPPSEQEVRAEANKVTDLIEELRLARHSNSEAEVTRNPSQFDLDNPQITVTLKNTSPGGLESQFFVGRESPDHAFAYCNSSERPRDVLAVKRSSIASVFFKDIDEFRVRRLLEANDVSTKTITLTERRDDKVKTLSLEKVGENNWQFLEPKLGPAQFSTTQAPFPKEMKELKEAKEKKEKEKDMSVFALINAVTSLRAESFEPIKDSRKLDERTALLKIELQTTEESKPGKKESAKLGPKQVLLIGDKLRGQDKYIAQLVGDNSVVYVDAKLLEPVFAMIADPKLLRSRDVAQFDPTEVDAVDIIKESKDSKEFVKLFRSKDKLLWYVMSGDKAPRRANKSSIEDNGLLSAIQGKGLIAENGFVDTDTKEKLEEVEKKFAQDKLLAKVMVWSNSLDYDAKKEEKKDQEKKDQEKKDQPKDKTDQAKKDEKDKEGKEKKDDKKEEIVRPELKKEAKELVTLSFASLTDDKVLVKRVSKDSIPIYFELSRKDYEKIVPPEMMLAFLDTSMTTFNTFDATKVELVRRQDNQTDTLAVEKEKKDEVWSPWSVFADKENKWKLVLPKDWPGKKEADQIEVESVVARLAMLRADRWVGSLKQRAVELGLDNPAITASVTTKVKDGDKETTKTFTLKIGLKSRKQSDLDGYFAVVDGTDDIFVVNAGVERLLKDAEFRDRRVLTFDPAKVKEIQCVIATDPKLLFKPLFKRDKDKRWIASGLEAVKQPDLEMVDKLLKILSDLQAVRYVDKPPLLSTIKLEEGKSPLKFEITMDDDKSTKYWVAIGAESEKNGPYYAQTDGLKGIVFLVRRDQFKDLMESGISYFSKLE